MTADERFVAVAGRWVTIPCELQVGQDWGMDS